jgi:excinuclease ABC subunit A
MESLMTVRGARLHNLKNITLSFPKNKLVVLTGLSGSGKSTLGFDILHKEGQRQYLESLGLVTDGLTRPPVEAICGLSPSISVDQRPGNHSPRSTVGTATEIYTFLRVLFARLGQRLCPACGKEIPPTFETSAADSAMVAGDDDESQGESFPCRHCGTPVPEIGMADFSFNKPAGACPSCTGLGQVLQANLKRLVNESKSLIDGAVHGWDPFFIQRYTEALKNAGSYYGCGFDPSRPVKEYTPIQRDLLFYGVEGPLFRRHYPDVKPPASVPQGRFEGVATNLLRRYAHHVDNPEYREKMTEFMFTRICPDCEGARLRLESRRVTVDGRTIVGVTRMPLNDLSAWLARLPAVLTGDGMIVAGPILADLGERVGRLIEVGVGYLTLERSSPTLSVGEAQRLRLAALLGSGLSGVLYVLDEPTIGLHQRDTIRLITVLRRLRDLGNTVLVVEHDLEMIRSADYVIDFGPGAGKHGGRVVAAGTPDELASMSGTLTGAFLSGRISVPIPARRRDPSGKFLAIFGARQHNLRCVSLRLPLGLLVAVTGVSGSGKSSLMFDILDRAARQRLYGAGDEPGDHDRIEGLEHLDKIITIDQDHIGRIPRSNAATYSDAFTPIREAFAAEPEARRLHMTPRHFSFNVPGGRCERCHGAGTLTVKMYFLPDVEVRCLACRGRRFTRETLSVRYRGHDIAQVLDLTAAEALTLFEDVPAAAARLQVLSDVGLGYLQLGQPATTLSGGEAQRVKLAKELGRKSTGRTLYLLDEPTTGLHPADTARLLDVLRRLVEAGNSVMVVEHNLDIIKTADWVVDLGPEGGAAGGYLVAEGTPEQVSRIAGSHTGRYLRNLLPGS